MFLIDIHLFQMIPELKNTLHIPLWEISLDDKIRHLITVVLYLVTILTTCFLPLFARMVVAKMPG